MSFWTTEEKSSSYLPGLLSGCILGAGSLLLGLILLRRLRRKKHGPKEHGACKGDDKSHPRHRPKGEKSHGTHRKQETSENQ